MGVGVPVCGSAHRLIREVMRFPSSSTLGGSASTVAAAARVAPAVARGIPSVVGAAAALAARLPMRAECTPAATAASYSALEA